MCEGCFAPSPLAGFRLEKISWRLHVGERRDLASFSWLLRRRSMVGETWPGAHDQAAAERCPRFLASPHTVRAASPSAPLASSGMGTSQPRARIGRRGKQSTLTIRHTVVGLATMPTSWNDGFDETPRGALGAVPSCSGRQAATICLAAVGYTSATYAGRTGTPSITAADRRCPLTPGGLSRMLHARRLQGAAPATRPWRVLTPAPGTSKRSGPVASRRLVSGRPCTGLAALATKISGGGSASQSRSSGSSCTFCPGR